MRSDARKRLHENQTTDARALVALYDERIALTKAFASDPWHTGAKVQEILDKGTELDAACEEFRRHYHPRAHRVLVGLRTVMAVSRTGSRITTIYTPDDTRGDL